MNLPARPIIVGTGAILLAAYVSAMLVMPRAGGRVVVGDATHHFVQLRSLVYDQDLDFRNEYMRIYELTEETPGTEWVFSELTSTGRVRNYMPIGPALLWAPLYLVLSLGQWLASTIGLAQPPDGFGRVLQMSAGITGVVAATAAALLSWRLARQWTAPTSSAAVVGVMGTWLGSHAIYYSLVSPSYSHAPSMFTASLFFLAWLTGRNNPTVKRAAGWGALAGLCALMRWQDAILLIVVAIDVLRWKMPSAQRLKALAAASVMFLLVFLPQMAVWTVLYGQPFALPQGASFMQWTQPHLFAVLVSANHGLLSWAPLLVPALAGLAAGLRREPTWRVPVGVVLLASWYVNAAVADWWAGEAYGARRFLSLFPLFALGLALWLDGARSAIGRRTRYVAVAALTVLNGFLLLQYQLFMKGLTAIAPYPTGWYDFFVTRIVVAWRALVWLAGS